MGQQTPDIRTCPEIRRLRTEKRLFLPSIPQHLNSVTPHKTYFCTMEMILSSTRRPDITFHSSGEIYITARVARILQISADSCINIAHHEGEYLLVAEAYSNLIGCHVARCHLVNVGSRYFRANSVVLCRAMLKACGVSNKAALMCGEPLTLNDKTYLPIITRTIL